MNVPVTNCGNCRYAEDSPATGPNGEAIIGQTIRVCRRFPPAVIGMPVPTRDGLTLNLLTNWPRVTSEMYCYEWEPENGAEDIADESDDA